MENASFPTGRSRRKKTSLARFIIAALIIIPIAIIGLKMATLDTSVSVVIHYDLPKLPDATDLINLDYGQQAVAVDGKIAYESEGQTPQPIASTTKMILALAVMQKKPFEEGTSGETIEITPKYYQLYEWYISNNGSTTAVEIGEKISEYDALASVLMASSNNLADTLALWAFGSIENYKSYAEEMLRSWGIEDTTIGTDASGYSKSTTSTARDLAKIGYHLMKNPILAKIVGQKTYEVPVAGLLENTNSLLDDDGISGIKTGYGGDESGYCLVLSYQKTYKTESIYIPELSSLIPEQTNIITSVVLGAPTRADSFIDNKTLVEASQKTLTPTQLLTGEASGFGYLKTWWSEDASLLSPISLTNIFWNDDQNSFTVDFGDLQSAPGKIKLSSAATISENLQFRLNLNGEETTISPVLQSNYQEKPTLWQRFLRALRLL